MAKIKAPKMVHITGEEMTGVFMRDAIEQWVKPYLDTSAWETFDLSCKSRDATDDRVLQDAIVAGARVGAIFKEPTITPKNKQVKSMGLKRSYPSPNGKMRAGWNGYTISRDTIMLNGQKSHYEHPIYWDRMAVGGEYGAVYKTVDGPGRMVTTFYPEDGGTPIIVGEKTLTDPRSSIVTYDIPLSIVKDQARHFFSRCLEQGIVPYITTKLTVFKWQEEYWNEAETVYNNEFKAKFAEKGILATDDTGNPTAELQHIISDAASMKLVEWKKGGYGFMSLNYDGDMLTDEMGALHGNAGLISSTLIGKAPDGSKIMEFEASHGTVSGSYKRYLQGNLESIHLQPMGLISALTGAIKHSAVLALARGQIDEKETDKVTRFANALYDATVETVKIPENSGKKLPSYTELLQGVSERLQMKLHAQGIGPEEGYRRTA